MKVNVQEYASAYYCFIFAVNVSIFVLQLIAIIEEGKNKILQLKKEDSEIQQEIALSEAAYVKAKQKNEEQQAILQKV
jgi:hypothetical protein